MRADKKPSSIARVIGSMFGRFLRLAAVGDVQRGRHCAGASCASNLPSFSPSGRYGFTCS